MQGSVPSSLEMAREIVSSGFMRPDRVNLAVFSIISACVAFVCVAGFIAGVAVGRNDIDVVRTQSQHVIETARLMREKSCG